MSSEDPTRDEIIARLIRDNPKYALPSGRDVRHILNSAVLNGEISRSQRNMILVAGAEAYLIHVDGGKYTHEEVESVVIETMMKAANEINPELVSRMKASPRAPFIPRGSMRPLPDEDPKAVVVNSGVHPASPAVVEAVKDGALTAVKPQTHQDGSSYEGIYRDVNDDTAVALPVHVNGDSAVMHAAAHEARGMSKQQGDAGQSKGTTRRISREEKERVIKYLTLLHAVNAATNAGSEVVFAGQKDEMPRAVAMGMLDNYYLRFLEAVEKTTHHINPDANEDDIKHRADLVRSSVDRQVFRER